MIFKKKISEEEKRFLQKQEEMNKLIEELENARDEEYEKVLDKITETIKQDAQELGIELDLGDDNQNNKIDDFDERLKKIETLSDKKEIEKEYEKLISSLEENLEKDKKKWEEKREIKVQDKYLLVPSSVQNLPHRCIFCNEEKGTVEIKGKIREKEISSFRLRKLKNISYTLGNSRSFASESARIFVKKLQLILAVGLCGLFSTIKLEQILSPEFWIALLVPLMIFSLLWIHPLQKQQLNYSLCKKHIIIKGLVIFSSWFLFCLGLGLLTSAFLFFEGNSDLLKFGGISIFISILSDIFLNRFIVPLYAVAETSDYRLVVVGAGLKFLDSFKQIKD